MFLTKHPDLKLNIPWYLTQIMQLSIDNVEVLGEALFDFSTVEDLINWLNTL